MKVELTIPDGLIPEGATVEYREVQEGETFISIGVTSQIAGGRRCLVLNKNSDEQIRLNKGDFRFVVNMPYEFPDCIKDGHWIAMDSNGSWYVYECEPCVSYGGHHWCAPDGDYTAISFLNIELPKVSDWKNSKMQKVAK